MSFFSEDKNDERNQHNRLCVDRALKKRWATYTRFFRPSLTEGFLKPQNLRNFRASKPAENFSDHSLIVTRIFRLFSDGKLWQIHIQLQQAVVVGGRHASCGTRKRLR